MTHHTRQSVESRLVHSASPLVSIVLGEQDTAWKPGMVDNATALTCYRGPGMVTYRKPYRRADAWQTLADFDPIAGDHDDRCQAENAEGDVCRLLEGDHAQHVWGEL